MRARAAGCSELDAGQELLSIAEWRRQCVGEFDVLNVPARIGENLVDLKKVKRRVRGNGNEQTGSKNDSRRGNPE